MPRSFLSLNTVKSRASSPTSQVRDARSFFSSLEKGMFSVDAERKNRRSNSRGRRSASRNRSRGANGKFMAASPIRKASPRRAQVASPASARRKQPPLMMATAPSALDIAAFERRGRRSPSPSVSVEVVQRRRGGRRADSPAVEVVDRRGSRGRRRSPRAESVHRRGGRARSESPAVEAVDRRGRVRSPMVERRRRSESPAVEAVDRRNRGKMTAGVEKVDRRGQRKNRRSRSALMSAGVPPQPLAVRRGTAAAKLETEARRRGRNSRGSSRRRSSSGGRGRRASATTAAPAAQSGAASLLGSLFL